MRTAVRQVLSLGVARSGDVQVEDMDVASSGQSIRCRLYHLPSSEPDAPLLIFIHGGGFFLCDVETHSEICSILARHAACHVLSVEYTLAPEADIAAQLQQVLTVCRWATSNGMSSGFDGIRIGLAGDSAGAYLATLAAIELNTATPRSVRNLLLLYPLTQTDDAGWARPVLANLRIVGRIACAVIRGLTGGPAINLFEHDLARCPPTILVTGRFDPTTEDAQRLANRLKADGVDVELQEHRFLPHGSLNLTSIAPFAVQAIEQAGRSLARHW